MRRRGAIAFVDVRDDLGPAEGPEGNAARRAARLGEFVLDFTAGGHGRLVKLLAERWCTSRRRPPP